jgi:radical SAM superfamily enzyme YgiQ (UPF0313 family)
MIGYSPPMETWPLRYEEPVFRPPSEATSLILQLTVGCSWNRCTYCGMYRGKDYRVRPASELRDEIRAIAPAAERVRRVFLADGDALAAPIDAIESVLDEIGESMPWVQRVGIYGDSRSILAKGADRLDKLRRMGLGIIYFGAESGDEKTLKTVRKGATVGRQTEASHIVREAGLKLSVMVLLGLAGREGSERHGRATGRFLVDAAPTYGAALTVTPVPGTEMSSAVEDGSFELPDRWGLLQELQWMLEEMDAYRGVFHANHASNYLPLKLRLPRDRKSAIELLESVIAEHDEARLTPEWARGL